MSRNQEFKNLVILYLGANAGDAKQIRHFLEKKGFNCDITFAADREAYLNGLTKENLNLIFADSTSGDLTGDNALEIARKEYPDIPFILLSDSDDEDFAIDTIKNGANDYILKDHLQRLLPAINRALRERRNQRKRTSLHATIRRNEKKLRRIFNACPMGLITCFLAENDQLYLCETNPAAKKMLHCGQSSLTGKKIQQILNLPEDSPIIESFKRVCRENTAWVSDQLNYGNDEKRNFEIHAFQSEERKVTIIISDIPDSKDVERELDKTRHELKAQTEELKQRQPEILEMEKLKIVKELAGAVAHEFAQPLQALSNYISLIEMKGANQEYIEKSKEVINRINKLKNSLQNIVALKHKDYLNMEIVDIKNSAMPQPENQKTVLIVDDEANIRNTLTELFRNSGYVCDEAENGIDALQLIKINHYGLIICDLKMPLMSGAELFREIKKHDNSANFIFLTGYEVAEKDKNVIEQADGVASKPVSFNSLLDMINKLEIKKRERLIAS